MMNHNKDNAIKFLSSLKRRSAMKLDLGHHQYISLYHINKWMHNVALKYAYGILLDYGCGGQPYRDFFSIKIMQYIGVDIANNPENPVDLIVGINTALPFRDNSVDSVLSTQVLEHVPNPSLYIKEVYRILNRNGHLILTAPMQWRHHEEPFDYYRYTKYGIEHLLHVNGFTIIRMDHSGGVFSLIGQILSTALAENNIIKSQYIFKFINYLFLFLDKKYMDNKDTLNWMCIAKKYGCENK